LYPFKDEKGVVFFYMVSSPWQLDVNDHSMCGEQYPFLYEGSASKGGGGVTNGFSSKFEKVL
jgi:hypothetical protein